MVNSKKKSFIATEAKLTLSVHLLSSGDTKTVADGMEFSTEKLDFTDTKNWTRSSIVLSGKTAYIGGAGSGNIYKVGL